MDDNLYDEFGNYIGPELDEEEEEEEQQQTWMDEVEPEEQMETDQAPSDALSVPATHGMSLPQNCANAHYLSCRKRHRFA